MLYELAPSHFHLVAPLFEGVWSDKALIDSVIEGSRPARIFADDTEQPRAAFLCVPEGDYYLIGDSTSPALRQFLQDRPGEAEVFDKIFAYFMLQPEWQRTLEELSGGTIPFFNVRAFRYPHSTIALLEAWRQSARSDAIVLPIDDAFLQAIDEGRIRTNHEFTRPHLEMITTQRFGTAVIVEDEVASVAWAYAVSSCYSSLFIDTEARFRRQGLATLASAAFIESSLARGLMPLWACLDTNIASASTALKLGFVEVPGRIESAWEPHGRNFRGPLGLWTKGAADPILPSGTFVWQRTTTGA